MASPIYAFTRKEITLITALFILGLTLGATLITMITGRQIDQLILEKNELITQVKDQEKQIKQLEENVKQYRQHFINKITIKLDSDANKHTQQEISNKIRELMSGMLGRDTSMVDPLLLRDIIHERYIIIGDETYQLKLIYLVVSDELQLYLKIEYPGKKKEVE